MPEDVDDFEASSGRPHIYLPEIFLVSAARYAMGREDYVVHEITAYIEGAWDDLSSHTRSLIQQDIERKLDHEERGPQDYSLLGGEMDRERWLDILELPTDAE